MPFKFRKMVKCVCALIRYAFTRASLDPSLMSIQLRNNNNNII